MNIREVIHNAIAGLALTFIVISLLVFGGALLESTLTATKCVFCAVGFFGGETMLKVVGEYEY